MDVFPRFPSFRQIWQKIHGPKAAKQSTLGVFVASRLAHPLAADLRRAHSASAAGALGWKLSLQPFEMVWACLSLRVPICGFYETTKGNQHLQESGSPAEKTHVSMCIYIYIYIYTRMHMGGLLKQSRQENHRFGFALFRHLASIYIYIHQLKRHK